MVYFCTTMQKITRQRTTEVVDSQTGEVVSSTDIKESYLEREPDYVKIYIKDLIKLNNLPKTTGAILFALLGQMNYSGQVVLVADIKREIAKDLSIKIDTVNKAIQELSQQEILIKKGRAIYLFNPYLFARGKWDQVKKIRLTVDYDKEDRRISAQFIYGKDEKTVHSDNESRKQA